jgi:hypothetical protein
LLTPKKNKLTCLYLHFRKAFVFKTNVILYHTTNVEAR